MEKNLGKAKGYYDYLLKIKLILLFIVSFILLSSSYFIDHQEFKSNKNYLVKYFVTNTVIILNTLSEIHCSLYPNWINIFPYTMENYKESLIYKNFKYIYENKIFITQSDLFYFDDNFTSNNNFMGKIDKIIYTNIYI